MTLILLAGYIGGTRTRLRLVKTQEDAEAREGVCFKNLYEERFANDDFDLVLIVQQFLKTAAQKLGYFPKPQKACFAVAGPVANNTVKITNLGRRLDAKRLEQKLDIPHIYLINDFEAVGYGVLSLDPSTDLYALPCGEQLQSNDPIAVIGATTGLGEAFVYWQSGSYHVYATEGGHADFTPRSEQEFDLLRYILDKNPDMERVSVERVVSGRGIVTIYQFLRDCQHREESLEEIGQIIRIWEEEEKRCKQTVDPAAVIAAAALAERDRLCVKTMEMFVGAYGAEAGNLALSLLPRRGLYVAGGIAAKNLPLFQKESFLDSFTQKGRMEPLLKSIPVYVVGNLRVGLIGAAHYAAKQCDLPNAVFR